MLAVRRSPILFNQIKLTHEKITVALRREVIASELYDETLQQAFQRTITLWIQM